jgi:hypothetical protein
MSSTRIARFSGMAACLHLAVEAGRRRERPHVPPLRTGPLGPGETQPPLLGPLHQPQQRRPQLPANPGGAPSVDCHLLERRQHELRCDDICRLPHMRTSNFAHKNCTLFRLHAPTDVREDDLAVVQVGARLTGSCTVLWPVWAAPRAPRTLKCIVKM